MKTSAVRRAAQFTLVGALLGALACGTHDAGPVSEGLDGSVDSSVSTASTPVWPRVKGTPVTASPVVKERVADLRSRGLLPGEWPVDVTLLPQQIAKGAPPSRNLVGTALGMEVPTAFEQGTDGYVSAAIPEEKLKRVARPASVFLPPHAGDAVRLEDETSHMAIQLTLQGASSAPIATSAGLAHYAAALSGADVFYRVRPDGTEAYAFFDQRPASEELAYEVDVSRVAGLHLVKSTLEFVDKSGTPLLRMPIPYVVSANGKRTAATLDVEGCKVDSNPHAMFRRTITAPGAKSCVVRVSWKADSYPAGVVVGGLTGPEQTFKAVGAFGGTLTQTFMIAGEAMYSVPTNTMSLSVEVIGAGGSNVATGGQPPAAAGMGAAVSAVIPTPSATTLYAEVGGNTPTGVGPTTGGGGFSLSSGQGGGASAIQTCSGSCGYTADPASDPRLVVAGGGGGGGENSTAGSGGTGGNAGVAFSGTSGAGGAGADTPPGGNGGDTGYTSGVGSAGGVGAGSANCAAGAGGSGTFGVGGSGGSENDATNGGGGGGGWVGGSGGGTAGAAGCNWAGGTAGGGGGGGAGLSFVESSAGGSVVEFPTSASPQVVITANLAGITLTATPGVGPALSSQTLTANVTGGPYALTGALVTFTCTSGPTTGLSSTVPSDSSGNASFTYTSSAAGTDQWTASFTPSGGTLVSSSPPSTPVVWTTIPTFFTATSTPPSTAYGTAVSLQASGLPPGATGTVTFTSGATTLCTGTVVVGTGAASCPTSSTLAPGPYPVLATYSGDATYASSTAGTAFTIAQASTTLSASATPPSTTYGNTITLTANVLPLAATGTVTFVSGASTLCTATISSGSASCATVVLPAGGYIVTAAYSGNVDYAGSSASTGFTITKAATSMVAMATPPVTTFGNAVTLSVSGLPAAATGAVTFASGSALCTATISSGSASCMTGILATGSYPVIAAYPGDSNYNASSASTTFTIIKAPTSFAAAALPSPAPFGATISLTASGFSPAATGSVSFFAGVTPLCSGPVVAGIGACSYVDALGPGTYPVTANYSGDSNFLASAASTSFTIMKAPTSFTATATPPATTYGNTVSLSASGLPSGATGSVTFTSGALTLCGPATVAAGAASCSSGVLVTGTYPVIATYSGDSSYLASTGTTSFTITKAPTTFTATASPTSTLAGNTVILSAAGLPSSATGTITFTSGATTLCGPATVVGGGAACNTGVLTGATYPVTATYSGDSNYLGSTASTSFTILCITSCTAGDNCGAIPDGCGGVVVCGPLGCAAPTTCGGGGKPNICGCTALTKCPAGDNCGTVPDGCGGTISCGTCPGGKACGGNVCGCKPITTCPAGDNCGTISDGCGGTVTCGACSGSDTCGGGGTPNVCGCTLLTACPAGDNCGTISDGCGGTISCGTCPTGTACGGNICGCTPITSCPAGAQCGKVSNGCGGTVDCGSCPAGETCSASNICGCTALTKCPAGENCGTIPDGCGGTLSCGAACKAPATCGGSGSPNVCGCAPITSCPAGDECGSVADTCGGMLSCGTCGSGESCAGNKCVMSPDAGPDSGGAKDSGPDSTGGKDSGVDAATDSGEKDSSTGKDAGEKDSGQHKDAGGHGDAGMEHHDSGPPPADAAADAGGVAAAGGGCSCRTAEPKGSTSPSLLWLGGIGLVGVRRLRRRTRPTAR